MGSVRPSATFMRTAKAMLEAANALQQQQSIIYREGWISYERAKRLKCAVLNGEYINRDMNAPEINS